METNTMQQELFIKMVIDEWDRQNNSFNKLLSSLTDEQLSKEIAPGRNTGIYVAGHLIAVSDGMLPLLGFGERLFPQLENIFIKSRDKSGLGKPPVTELKDHLKAINTKFAEHIQSMAPAEWFKRHMAVSEEDFAKEPHRNKLNIIINRAGHMNYHLGQLIFLQ